MNRSTLESIASSWMEFWQGKSLATFNDIHAVDFIDHCPSGRANDRAGLIRGIRELYMIFPDFYARIDVLVVDEMRSLVAICWSASGHMRGRFLGVEATGQRVVFTGIEVLKVRGGQVTERWGEWDEAAIRSQISNLLDRI